MTALAVLVVPSWQDCWWVRPGSGRWGACEIADRLPLISIDSGLDGRQAAIVWELSLPRVLLGALVGAALSVSGAAYQGVFRNPLADPYLLGVAAGAGLGATIVIVGGGASGLIPPAAFLGPLRR